MPFVFRKCEKQISQTAIKFDADILFFKTLQIFN